MRAWARRQDSLLLTPARKLRRVRPTLLICEFVCRRRNQCEQPFAYLQGRFRLLDHGAKTSWGLATCVVGKLTALTLRTLWREQGRTVDRPFHITRLIGKEPGVRLARG